MDKNQASENYNTIIDVIGAVFWFIIGLVIAAFLLKWFVGWIIG